MKLITREDIANDTAAGFAKGWYQRHPNREAILQLGPTPDPDKLDRLVQEDFAHGWTLTTGEKWTWQRCSICDRDVEAVIEVSIKDIEGRVHLCKTCVEEALAIFRNLGM